MSIALRVASLVVPAICLGLPACDALTSPGADVGGRWTWEFNQNPSGSSMTFSLSTAGGDVSGSGVSYGIGPARVADSMSVTGTQYRAPGIVAFRLTLSFASGTVVAYAGRLVGRNELRGTWNAPADTVAFFRE